MFNCQLCGKTSKLHEKVHFVTLEKRPKVYPQRLSGNRARDEEGKWRYTPDNGGKGFEIVKEAKACGVCAAQRA